MWEWLAELECQKLGKREFMMKKGREEMTRGKRRTLDLVRLDLSS